jgi:hypothetical protein
MAVDVSEKAWHGWLAIVEIFLYHDLPVCALILHDCEPMGRAGGLTQVTTGAVVRADLEVLVNITQ